MIGILSDSHGRHLMVRKAVALFDKLGATHLIHCGDVGGPDVLDELAGHACTLVWGNTDEPSDALRAYAASLGIAAPEAPALLTFDDKRFAIFHGHERGFPFAARLDVDYVLYGHSHEKNDTRIGTVRFINPGALHRAAVKTVATLDAQSGELAFHQIE